MWPWEHLAVGYVAFSLANRAFGSRAPDRSEVVVLAVATQLPDLVDKPLGWRTDLLTSGVSFAHSYLVAVPLVTICYLLARRSGKPRLGLAFATGYLLHTPADVLARYLLNGELIVDALVWPLASAPAGRPTPVFGRAVELWFSYLGTIRTPAGQAYLLLEFALFGTTVIVWAADRRWRCRSGSTTASVE